jgi:hypothetical protein
MRTANGTDNTGVTTSDITGTAGAERTGNLEGSSSGGIGQLSESASLTDSGASVRACQALEAPTRVNVYLFVPAQYREMPRNTWGRVNIASLLCGSLAGVKSIVHADNSGMIGTTCLAAPRDVITATPEATLVSHGAIGRW